MRVFVHAVALAAAIAILAYFLDRRSPPPPAAGNEASTLSNAAAQPAGAGAALSGESQILAACQPHLSKNTISVPNLRTEMRNPAAARMKIRLWVNDSGFVTQAFVAGANSYAAADQEAALDYVKILTFTVPSLPECHSRKMELIGNFLESRSSNGEWETILDLYPRYSFDGTRIVQNR